MKRPSRVTAVSVVLALGVSGGLALQASGFVDGSPGQVLMGDSPQPPHAPQTPEQADYGKQYGRALPQRELLPPSRDPALRGSRPAYGKRQLQGKRTCAAADVLPGLAKPGAADLKDCR